MYTLGNLIRAIGEGDLALVKQHYENGVDINCYWGWLNAPALQYAIYYKQNEIVRWLCEQSVNTDYTDRFGYTPLQWAIYYSNSGIVQLLISHGIEFEWEKLWDLIYPI